jgi:hypothetical protein
MLSAHEFATLMLVKDSADQIADREALETFACLRAGIMNQIRIVQN